jgi:hypothetical protein
MNPGSPPSRHRTTTFVNVSQSGILSECFVISVYLHLVSYWKRATDHDFNVEEPHARSVLSKVLSHDFL